MERNDDELVKQFIEAANKHQADLAMAKPKSMPTVNTPITPEQQAYAEELIKDAVIERSARIDLAIDTDWCTSAQDLAQVMLNYIKYTQTYERRGVRLYELNKRFGLKAKVFGSTTKAVMKLVTSCGKAEPVFKKGVVVYLEPMSLNHALKHIETLVERNKLKNEYIEEAFEAMKR